MFVSTNVHFFVFYLFFLTILYLKLTLTLFLLLSQDVYLRGMEPSVRMVGWRILLDVYPPEFDGNERLAVLHSKVGKYEKLKEVWKQAYREGRLTKPQIDAITLACVDVVRTDRCKLLLLLPVC